MTRTRSSTIGGGIAGLGAGLTFAGLHALIIVPIWDRMLMGLAFGVAAGLACGCAHGLLMPDSPARFRNGVTFGFHLWLAAVPVTLVNVWLRNIGFARTHESWTDAIAVALALIGGAVLGHVRSGSRKGVVCGALAVLLLTMAMGGPVNVGRSVRALEILFAVLIAAMLGGIAVAFIEPALRKR